MEVAPGDPWAAYARTVVEFCRPREGDVVVATGPDGSGGRMAVGLPLPVTS